MIKLRPNDELRLVRGTYAFVDNDIVPLEAGVRVRYVKPSWLWCDVEGLGHVEIMVDALALDAQVIDALEKQDAVENSVPA